MPKHVKMLTVGDLEALGCQTKEVICAFRGGSREIVDPAPTGTDLDVCIHVKNVENAIAELSTLGFDAPQYNEKYRGEYLDFMTLRKGEVNLLLFGDAYEFGAVWGATSYAKSVNMKEKEDRYDLFERVRLPWRE